MTQVKKPTGYVKLNEVRLSFPDLFEAVQFEGQGPFNYRAAFLVEPGSANDKAITAAMGEVAKEKWAAKAGAILTAAKASPQKCCYISGDLKEYDGYAGNMVLSSSRQQEKGRPGVYDRDKSPLSVEDGKPYAGCYVNATVELWAQDNSYGKAIRCTLVAVQFAKDGDAFSAGSKPSEDEFDDLSAEGEDVLA